MANHPLSLSADPAMLLLSHSAAAADPADEDNNNTPTLAHMPALPSTLKPEIPACFASSSLCLSTPASNPSSTRDPLKTTRPIFLLPGPALNHPHLNLASPQALNPPPNFAIVAPGIFRSSFPKPEHFQFLAQLKLRTILTLVQEPYPLELVKHYESVGIKLIQYAIPGNKEPFVHIPEDKIRLALRQVLDVRNHPMLIHCNKGKHRTGCLVGCLRKLQHWSSTAIFDEYRRYAFPKSRNMDQQFIELFDHSPVWEEVDPDFAPEWLDLSM
ncbi:hypothetical protein PtB15_1B860 [Puccinia triticina]|nr:hypothetical protein PtB15_1B860 [Puccinia triticina]